MAIYDKDIRQLLITSLSDIPEFNNNDTYLINELDICGGFTRADIAIVNGQLHGYEIKSPQDSLERLPRQVPSYNEVFDTMTLITCKEYLNQALKIIPKWWGIYYIDDSKKGLTLKKKRKSKFNKHINCTQLANLLWKQELIDLIYSNTDIVKGIKSKSRYKLAEIAADNISRPVINDYVRNVLKHRQEWRAVKLSQLCDDLCCNQPTDNCCLSLNSEC